MQRSIGRWLLGALVIVLVSAGGSGRAAHGGEFWEWDDPVVLVNGQVLHVKVGVPAGMRSSVATAGLLIAAPIDADVMVAGLAAPRLPITVGLIRSGAVGPDGSVLITASATLTGAGEFPVAIMLEQPGAGAAMQVGVAGQPVSTQVLLPGKSRYGSGAQTSFPGLTNSAAAAGTAPPGQTNQGGGRHVPVTK